MKKLTHKNCRSKRRRQMKIKRTIKKWQLPLRNKANWLIPKKVRKIETIKNRL